MRQCHLNLTLANQQSDSTKTLELRDEMQRLNQQQAKLHFSMDELLCKERKLDSLLSTKLPSTGKPPTMCVTNGSNNLTTGNVNYGVNNMMEIKPEYMSCLSPQAATVDSPHSTTVQPQTVSLPLSQLSHRHVLSPQREVALSPQNSQICVDNNEIISNDTSFDNNIHQLPNNGPTMLQENIAYVNM